MRVLQINVLKETRSTGRTTSELDLYLKSNGVESFVAYGIGKQTSKSDEFRISNWFSYYLHNIFARITGKQGFYSYFVTKRFLNWVTKIKPDIIHCRNLHSSFINLRLLKKYLDKNQNVGLILTTHDFWFFTGSCPYPKCEKYKIVCKDCFLRHNLVNGLFLNSQKNHLFKKNFLDRRRLLFQANSHFSESILTDAGIDKNKIKCVYNWIDSNKFFPEIIEDFYSNSLKPVVLTIWSCLDENSERFLMLAQVANKLSNQFDFVAIGKPNFYPNRYPNIKFVGEVKQIDLLRKYYSNASVLFNPSTTDTFGKVVAEALLCGTPCVVFNKQALPELVSSSCGKVVDEYSADFAASAIVEVIGKGKKFFSSSCIEKGKKCFDYLTNCKEIVEMYNEVLK